MNTDIKMAEEGIVQDIQENLEKAKQELSEYGENLMRDLELRAFADLYGVLVPKEKREESAKAAREIRDKFWNEALKKAKGNREKAFRIWAELD
jgi:vacuolar-type H+-ATPase subunit H